MADYKTISIEKALYRALFHQKRPEETWTQTIERLTEVSSASTVEGEA